ncbi:mediator of RNA polymerase II transcription subunit 22-like [Xenia sp. Carnegie-2017]|uniref:mediator of RNA polymerase II transcription subunit 22-like n=1 Tax=Xenia sp. Carnegie-2017 TaxID=2897299 RepID=UPI001F040E07|nr:mediator of RNA polymerase II transcription subunit 22-like [Xenia sp. Carnegie-2017]
MAQSRGLSQSKQAQLKSYNKRLKDDVKSILDNFTEIIKSSELEEETQVSRLTQCEQDENECKTRAANIVRAGESLLKLVSDIKEFLILNDFPGVNESISQRCKQLYILQKDCQNTLNSVKEDLAGSLYELEKEYYNSYCKVISK